MLPYKTDIVTQQQYFNAGATWEMRRIYRVLRRLLIELIQSYPSIEPIVNVKGLHIEGYSVPCILETRDGIPLKEV